MTTPALEHASPADDHQRHAVAAHLRQLERRTHRRRLKAQRRVLRALAESRRTSIDLDAQRDIVEACRADEEQKRQRAEHAHERGHGDDVGRRGVSTAAHSFLVALCFGGDAVIDAAALQVLGWSQSTTVAVALFFAAAFVGCAWVVGRTFRRVHTTDDPHFTMSSFERHGVYVTLGIAIAICAGMGWARLSYLNATGRGGLGSVALLTLLSIASFAVAAWAMFAHHAPLVDDYEDAVDRREGEEETETALSKKAVDAAEEYRDAWDRRVHLARQCVRDADEIGLHYQIALPDEEWLARERAIARGEASPLEAPAGGSGFDPEP